MVHPFTSTIERPIEQDGWVVCHYINATDRIQVVRVVNIPSWQFERVVFPGERLLFEVPPHTEFEVQEDGESIVVHPIPCDRIPCSLPQ